MQRQLVLQVGHVERFNPVLSALEARLTHPRFIEAHRLSPFPNRSTDIGVVLDLMIHDLDVVLAFVKSPVVAADAVGIPVLSKSEDIANARLRFASGCIANVTASRVALKRERKMRIFQPDAYLVVDYGEHRIRICRREPQAHGGGLPNITYEERVSAESTPLSYNPVPYPIEAPHFIWIIKDQIDQLISDGILNPRASLIVRTTLDLDTQHFTEAVLKRRIAGFKNEVGALSRNVNNAALVVMDPHTGEILALVGSTDYFDESIDGSLDIIAEAVEQDVGALLGQAARDAEADAAGRAGDDGRFLLEHGRLLEWVGAASERRVQAPREGARHRPRGCA
jgi:hypothetical protein